MVLALVRGDHRLNEIKLRNALGAGFRPAHAEEIEAEPGPARVHRPGGRGAVPVIKDAAIEGEGYVCGANRPDAHLIGVVPGRDFTFEELDIRSVEAGDLAPGGGPIELEPAIEVGQIFKLGTRYSEPLGRHLPGRARHRSARSSWAATGSGRRAPSRPRSSSGPTSRGSYGRASIAPWDVHLVGLGKAGDEVTEAAERLYAGARRGGLEVVYDDREAGPGEKLTDAELLGCPLRLVVGQQGAGRGRRRGAGPPQRGRRAPRRSAEAASRAARAARWHRLGPGGQSACSASTAPAPGPPDPTWPAAAAADDSQPGRLRAAGWDPGVPLSGAGLRRRANASPPRSSTWRSRRATTWTGSWPG